MKILSLYAEPMAYVIEIFKKVQKDHEITCYFQSTDSGHEFKNIDESFGDGREILKHVLLGKVRLNKIDLLLVSGFISWRYTLLSWVARYAYDIDVVCISDKQFGHKLSSLKYFLYVITFTCYWSAGDLQDKLVRKIFKHNFKYLSKFYSATDNYTQCDLPVITKKPLKFLFLGRPIYHKGFDLLVEVFRRQPTLELIVVGSRVDVEIPNIHFKGYLNQDEIIQLVSKENFVGVLPSRYEPWGLVVHEMLSVGVPMICSQHVGAAQDLLVGKLDRLILQDLTEDELELKILYFSRIHARELDLLKAKCKIISRQLNSDLIVTNFNNYFG